MWQLVGSRNLVLLNHGFIYWEFKNVHFSFWHGTKFGVFCLFLQNTNVFLQGRQMDFQRAKLHKAYLQERTRHGQCSLQCLPIHARCLRLSLKAVLALACGCRGIPQVDHTKPAALWPWWSSTEWLRSPAKQTWDAERSQAQVSLGKEKTQGLQAAHPVRTM